MNKWALWMTTAIVGAAIAGSGSAWAADMKGMYDFSKVEMIRHEGAELVPLRKVAESLGYTVRWNEQDRTVVLMKGSMQGSATETGSMDMMGMDMKAKEMSGITVAIDSNRITVNGMEKELMSPAMLWMDTAYVSKDLVVDYLIADGEMK